MSELGKVEESDSWKKEGVREVTLLQEQDGEYVSVTLRFKGYLWELGEGEFVVGKVVRAGKLPAGHQVTRGQAITKVVTDEQSALL